MSGDETGALASGWHELAGDYELGRRKPDAFDRILDWPAELSVLGDVTGLDVLTSAAAAVRSPSSCSSGGPPA